MPRIQPLEPEDAPQESRELMEQGEQAVGQMLNFFKQLAVAPAVLKGYLEFDGALHEGALDSQTFEAIYIATANYNSCTYCLSAHSGAAQQAGISEDGIQQFQQFESEDENRAAALRFAQELVETRGHPSDEAFNGVRDAGYTDEQIIEMVAVVGLSTFTNYMNETLQTEVDLPEVEPIQQR